MPFVIQPAVEADLEHAAGLLYAAFEHTSPITSIIYPNGNTAFVKADNLKGLTEGFKSPNTTCLKVVDTDNNDRMVAWISWTTYKHDQTDVEWDKDFVSPVKDEQQSHPDIVESFRQGVLYSGLHAAKREHIRGKARVYVSLVITHPDYHRRGIGRMMLDKAAKHANNLGLPAILTSSQFGVPLYLKEGYEAIPGAVINMDLKPWGKDMIYKNLIMERGRRRINDSSQ